MQGEGFRAQAGSRLRPGALDAGAKAVSGAPERCRQVGPDWNLGPRRQPRGDRPCHDADTPGGQSFAAGMAGAADGGPRRGAAIRCGKADDWESGLFPPGRSDGSRAMGNHAIAMRISAESAGGQRSVATAGNPQRNAGRNGAESTSLTRCNQSGKRRAAPPDCRHTAPSPAGTDTPAAARSQHVARDCQRRATQSRSAAATCASIPRTMARISRYACHIFSLPGAGRLLLG